MNEILQVMSQDMRISRYEGETDESFAYRTCYSGLGLWCLKIGQMSTYQNQNTSKHNQTILLSDLIFRFTDLFPFLSSYFSDPNDQNSNFSIKVRRIYEETGYLLTDDKNRNQLVNHGRCVKIGGKALFFGLPENELQVIGLGVYSIPTDFVVKVEDILLRDILSFDDYFNSQFDFVNFDVRDINQDILEFFDPKSHNVPSMSWGKHMTTGCTVARNLETGSYYKVIKDSDVMKFDEIIDEKQKDSLFSYEYRRLYFALKAHYNNPLVTQITKLDRNFSKITVYGHLPNREYYYLLLLTWPLGNAFNKTEFISSNEQLFEIESILSNIGIKVSKVGIN